MKTYYHSDFLIGLYAFLRQLELSIHRGINEWNALGIYVRAHRMIEIINHLVNSNVGNGRGVIISPAFKLIAHILRKGYMDDEEINELITLLIFSRDIFYDKNPNENGVIDLRIRLRNFSNLIRTRICKSKRKLQKADKVEHFNQSDYGVFYELKDIVPYEWYEFS